jgi:type VI secretion system protein ImpH
MEALAAHGWGRTHSVEEWLTAEGHRFDFHQVVRLLQMRERAREGAGRAVRFRSAVGLSFPASDVARVVLPEHGEGRPEVTVSFLGLTGVQGPLPSSFAHLVHDRTRHGDTALRDFLDLFHHRLVELFHEARVARRVGLEVTSPEHHAFAGHLYALLGLGTPGLREQMELPARALLGHTGLLARRPRALADVLAVVARFLGAPVEGGSLRGAWYPLDEETWTRLGQRNHVLGRSAVLGQRTWEQQGGIQLVLGPLRWMQLLDLLPGRPGFLALRELLRFLLGPFVRVELRLRVRSEEMPPARLHRSGGPRLGWTTWLKGRARGVEREVRLSARHLLEGWDGGA